MLFKSLTIENIRSYENLKINFPKGSVLLAGDIGSGKTSILLALQFALFGLQPGQKGASILRQGEDKAYACLELEIEGKQVTLERAIKKSKSGSITQDVNVITIDQEREELSTSEMKNKVIDLLSYPKEFVKKSNLLYKFTVYTPQEEMKSIVLEKPEIRLDTLRHIFGIDRYKRIKENAGVLIQKIKEQVRIKEVLASELNLVKERLNIENENKITLTREVNNLNIEFQNLILEKEKAEEKLSSFQKTLDEKRDLESSLEKYQIRLQAKKDLESRMKREISLMQNQIQKEISFSESQFEEVKKLLEKHKNSLEEKSSKFIEVSSRISALESKKESPLELKNKIISLENCPTCLQRVGVDHKTRIEKKTKFEIEEINRDLERIMELRENLQKEIEREKELIKNYEYDKSNLEQHKIKADHQRTLLIKIKSDAFVLDRTSNEVKELLEKIFLLEEKIKTFSESNINFEKAKTKFQEILEISKAKEITIATKTKELEILRERLKEISSEITRKEKIQEHVNKLRSLQDWLQEKFISMINLTEKNVMAKLRSEFSKIFSEWFTVLVSDSLSVRLDEDFTPIISNKDYEIDYEFLSGGERTATALAYRLSLNQVLNSILSQIKTKDILILDEPTDGFSTEQIEKMRDIFEQLKAEQMILVSHEEKIEGFVDNIIRIRKDGTSKIEQS